MIKLIAISVRFLFSYVGFKGLYTQSVVCQKRLDMYSPLFYTKNVDNSFWRKVPCIECPTCHPKTHKKDTKINKILDFFISCHHRHVLTNSFKKNKQSIFYRDLRAISYLQVQCQLICQRTSRYNSGLSNIRDQLSVRNNFQSV